MGVLKMLHLHVMRHKKLLTVWLGKRHRVWKVAFIRIVMVERGEKKIEEPKR
jgi:hypothetical protein